MKLTLLEIVQDILNDMDGDEVSDIAATIESAQIALIVKSTYAELMASRNWPHMKTAFTLTDGSATVTPTYFTLPENIKEVEWIKYNKRSSTDTRDKYEDLKYMQPKDFLDMLSDRNSSASNVMIVDAFSGLKMNVYRDRAPQYWTSFDDEEIFVDAFDSAVEAYVQGSKTSCWGVRTPTWTHSNGAYPDLPIEAYPLLVEEAKSTAFYALRQVHNEKAEQKATRQTRWLARKAWRTKGGVRYPNYGRSKAFSGHERNPLLDKG